MSPNKSAQDGYIQFRGRGDQWVDGGTYYFNEPIDFSKYKGIRIEYKAYLYGSGGSLVKTCVCTSPTIMNTDKAQPANLVAMATTTSSEYKTIDYYFGKDSGIEYLTFGMYEQMSSLNNGYGMWHFRNIILLK